MSDERVSGEDRENLRRYNMLAAIFGVLTALLLFALVTLVQRSGQARDAALARKQHSFNVMLLTSETDGSLARAEAALGRFVSNGDRRTGTVYYEQWRRAGTLLDQLATIVEDNPEQLDRAEELRRLYDRRGKMLSIAARFANYRKGWQALSLFAQAGRSPSLPRMGKLLRQISDTERAILDERASTADNTVLRSNALTRVLSAVGVLLSLSGTAALWLAMKALGERREARHRAQAEIDRAEMLERAVAERTLELSAANRKLTEEAATRADAEAKLRQVQKMEAVGQLTGGIAHDFNNMLAVVLGGLELARKRVAEQANEATRHIDNALDGANRAAALTRRLLSFARSEPLLPSGVDPGNLMHGMGDLIDRTIGERIEVRIHAQTNLWPVWVDPFQLENAILNLCVNARDAMSGAGLLRMEAANARLDDGEVGTLPAGEYVRIAVCDNGRGMSPQVLERVFEPFFTTKPVGEGTGLGLSQLFGFARQSGGDVMIRSTEGFGTTVALYLPRHRGEVGSERVSPALITPVVDPGERVILVVEDDPRVRVATGDALQELGYVPILCESGNAAMSLLATRDDIGLLISDVIMPGMTGPELVKAIAPLHPDLAVLFVTGYVGEAGDGDGLAGYEVLRKPFTISALSNAVAAAIHYPKPTQLERITDRAA